MTTIQTMTRRLRAAADALDLLIEVEGTARIAENIRKTFVRPVAQPRKLHWTQRPENKARLRKMRRAQIQTMKAKVKIA